MDICGIDPGKKGAVAVISTDRPGAVDFYALPIENGEWCPWQMNFLAEKLSAKGVRHIFIEACHAFPGISAAANASVMEAFGMWRGALAQHFHEKQVHIIMSMTWKKAMNLLVPIVKVGKKATVAEKKLAYMARKVASIKAAEAMFMFDFITPKGRKLDGEAEAALLAAYGASVLALLKQEDEHDR